jgi:hypothetical protein
MSAAAPAHPAASAHCPASIASQKVIPFISASEIANVPILFQISVNMGLTPECRFRFPGNSDALV